MRSQSALEFLITYSWAFVILSIFVASVMVLVFTPSRGGFTYVPSSCYLTLSLTCYQSVLSSGSSGSQFTIILQNNMGVNLYFPDKAISVRPSTSSSITYTGICLPQNAPAGSTIFCSANLGGLKPSVGSQLNPSFTLNYKICAPVCADQIYNTSGTSLTVVSPSKGVSSVSSQVILHTDPSTGGQIVLGGVAYSDGANVPVIAGINYPIYAMPPSGNSFSFWTPTGSITVANNGLQSTTANITAGGVMVVLQARFDPTPLPGPPSSTTTSTTSTTSTSTTTTVNYGTQICLPQGSACTSLTLPSGYDTYICTGGNYYDPFWSQSWTADIGAGYTYASIGRQSSNICSVATDDAANQQLDGVALRNPPPVYITTASGSFGLNGGHFSVPYNVLSSGSFVVITTACGNFACSAPSVPSGCTQTSGHYGSITSYIAVCPSQNAGSYTISESSSSNANPVYVAVYVYSNANIGEIQVSSFTASLNPISPRQNQTLSVTVAATNSPFSYNYFVYNSLGTLVTSVSYTGVSSTSNSFTFQVLPAWGTGTFTANVIATDKNRAPANRSLTFYVTPTYLISSFTASLNNLLPNQYQTLNTNDVMGGNFPYSYNYLVYNAPGNLVTQSLYLHVSPTSNSFTFQVLPAWGTGTFTANVIVTDNTQPTPNQATNALTFNVFPSVPIMLSNLQTTSSTPAGFQQNLTINSQAYQSFINPTWNNVEFTTGQGATGNILQAWVESGASNAATSTVVWVNLGQSTMDVAGSGSNTLTIYMNILPTIVMTSNTAPTGEAPQLSSAYAQYDNGAKVFDNYENFLGTSLSSQWVLGPNPSITVNNGLKLISRIQGQYNGIASTFTTNPQTRAEDFYAYGEVTNIGTQALIGFSRTQAAFSSNAYAMSETGYDPNGGNPYYFLYTYKSCQKWTNLAGASRSSYNLFTDLHTTASTAYLGKDYGTDVSDSSCFGTSTSEYTVIYDTDASQAVYVRWIRVRKLPPNDIMPSQS